MKITSRIIPRPAAIRFTVTDPANGFFLGSACFAYRYRDSVTGWYRSCVPTCVEWGYMVAKKHKHSLGIREPKVSIEFLTEGHPDTLYVPMKGNRQ